MMKKSKKKGKKEKIDVSDPNGPSHHQPRTLELGVCVSWGVFIMRQ